MKEYKNDPDLLKLTENLEASKQVRETMREACRFKGNENLF